MTDLSIYTNYKKTYEEKNHEKTFCVYDVVGVNDLLHAQNNSLMKVKVNDVSINGLPTAVNLANVGLSHLTQLPAGESVAPKKSTSLRSQVQDLDVLVSSERTYTKEDAILKQWNKAGSFNIYEVLNGGKVNLQSPIPSESDLQDLEASLRQNGIGTEIDWSDLKFDFRGLGFSTNNPTWSLGEDDFQTKADYFASRYAAMKVRIQETYSDEEQQAQLERLYSVCQSTLEELANGYADIIGDFCTANGVSGERDKIYQAVLDGVNERISDYETMLANESLFSELKNSDDAWLLQDDEYVASLLRKKAVPENDDFATNNSGYTWSDLDTLGRYVSAMTQWENKADAVFTRDETEIALEFAMLSMKMDELNRSNTLSPDMNDTMRKLISGFMEGYMERTDKKLTELRNTSAAIGDQEGFAALDRSFIQSVYNHTMKFYYHTEHIKDALTEGRDYSISQPTNSARFYSYRYKNSVYHN